MNQQEILKKIGGIIAELKEQYTYLQAAESGFNDLELELFMANANFLTDHIAILQKVNHQIVPAQLPVAKPVLQIEETPEKLQIPDYFDAQDLLHVEKETLISDVVEPEVTESQLEDVQQSPQETIILPEVMPQDEQTEIIDDTSFINIKSALSLEDTSFIDIKSALTEQPEQKHDDTSFIGQKTTTEVNFQDERFDLKNQVTDHHSIRPETVSLDNAPDAASNFSISSGSNAKTEEEPTVYTLNDRIAAQKGLDQFKTKTETASKPAQDLQSMISLNDKLLFVKELFNGYNLAYAEAINILNRYTDFEQAKNFLNQNYTVKNGWKDKPVTTDKFMNLLRKKFD